MSPERLIQMSAYVASTSKLEGLGFGGLGVDSVRLQRRGGGFLLDAQRSDEDLVRYIL